VPAPEIFAVGRRALVLRGNAAIAQCDPLHAEGSRAAGGSAGCADLDGLTLDAPHFEGGVIVIHVETDVVLGTATPIQTSIEELWDLLDILSNGADHVLGRAPTYWRDPRVAVPLVTGQGISRI